MPGDVFIPSNFLGSFESLVYLDLFFCNFRSIPVMKSVSDSLIHLRELHLLHTGIDDSAVFVLCGHTWPCSNISSACFFTKNCPANTELKLQTVLLDETNVSSAGVACMLTHMPTLKDIGIPPTLLLPDIIQDIIEQRKVNDLPPPVFQLEKVPSVGYFDNFEDFQVCHRVCPNLTELPLSFVNCKTRMGAVCKILEESELKCLKVVYLNSFRFHDMLIPKFECFWSKIGPQLETLILSDSRLCHRDDLDGLMHILALCPNLTLLSVRNVLLEHTDMQDFFWDDFPRLSCLRAVHLNFRGDSDIISKVACKLFLSTFNLEKLYLDIPVSENIVFPCMLDQRLSFLKNFYIRGKETGEKLKKFLQSKMHVENTSAMHPF